jgi:beta-glucanase (GH16 family)
MYPLFEGWITMNSKTRPGWKLVWADEFDGSGVDPDKWDFDIGNGFFDYQSHTWVPGWGNEELQYYTDHFPNVAVKDSVLTISAVKESLHGCGYTSTRLKTRKKDGTPLFAKRYGRFEFRAIVPHGKGLWPALWMLPLHEKYGGWAASGEIDVMEIVGEIPTQVLGSIHFGSGFPKRELVTHTHTLDNQSTVADWHVYAVEWTPGEIKWFVDDQHWATQSFWWSSSLRDAKGGLPPRNQSDVNPWPSPFDQEFYIVMNVAVGGNFPGHPNAQTSFPAQMLVDYVRVYDKIAGYEEVVPRSKGKIPYSRRK